jgi:hypothetical protein
MRNLCRAIRLPVGRVSWRVGLSGMALGALLGAAQPADALVIIPSFDTSWTMGFNGGPAAPAAATTAVNNVIAEYEADFSNPVTITIAFGWGETAGERQTSGAASDFPQNIVNFPNPADEYNLAQVKGFYATAVGLQPPTACSLLRTPTCLPRTQIRVASRINSSSPMPNTRR